MAATMAQTIPRNRLFPCVPDDCRVAIIPCCVAWVARGWTCSECNSFGDNAGGAGPLPHPFQRLQKLGLGGFPRVLLLESGEVHRIEVIVPGAHAEDLLAGGVLKGA